MNAWIAVTLLAGGMFAGGVVTIAWTRSPVWTTMPAAAFRADFERTIRTADKVQPALAVATLVAAIGAVLTTEGAAWIAAVTGAAGLVAILAASGAILVPLQRRIIASPPDDLAAIDSMRSRWIRGHLGRSGLAVLSFAAVVIAAVV
jgi:hypothetical protein